MTDSLTYRRMGTAARGQAHALFAQTMAYVAATAALRKTAVTYSNADVAPAPCRRISGLSWE